jgi:hypothetical protein
VESQYEAKKIFFFLKACRSAVWLYSYLFKGNMSGKQSDPTAELTTHSHLLLSLGTIGHTPAQHTA